MTADQSADKQAEQHGEKPLHDESHPESKRADEAAHAARHAVTSAAHLALLPVDIVRDTVTQLPTPVYYAGLGAMAVFGVIEWPVAGAIGLGYALATRRSRRAPTADGARP